MMIPRAAPPIRYLVASAAVCTAAAIAVWTLATGGASGFGSVLSGCVLSACIAWFGLNAQSRALRVFGLALASSAGAVALVGIVGVRTPAGASPAEWTALLMAAIALCLTRARSKRAGDLRQFARLVGIAVPIFILALIAYDPQLLAIVHGFRGGSRPMAVALFLLLAAIGVDRPATSLRWQIAYVGVAVIAPLAALMLHFASYERETALANAATQLAASAEFIAEGQEVVVGQARRTLEFLARSPDVKRPAPACADAMSGFLPVVASLISIYSVRRDGSVACSSRADLMAINVGDRTYVQDAFARREPTVSGFFITRVRKEPRIALTVPIPGDDDLILAATLDLSSLEPPLERALENGGSATLIDKNGVVIARRPAAPSLIGADIRTREFVAHALAEHDKPFFGPELDGAPSVFAARPVLFGEGTLVIGLPRERVVGPLDQRLNDRLVLIALILLASFMLGLFGSEIAVLLPLRRLIAYARELEAGDLSARPRIGSMGEVRALGRALALTAASIEDRERRLSETEALFRRLFEHSPDAKIIVRLGEGQDCVIETWNDAAARFFGLAAADVIGKRPGDVLPDGKGDFLERDMRGSLGQGGFLSFERESEDGGLAFALEIVQMPLLGPDGTVERIFVSARDISERKRVERLKSEFVSTVSHELRTPLTSIAGSLGLLAGGVAGPLSDKAKGLIGIAHSNSLRLVRLINDILDIEKIEAGRISFDVQTLAIAEIAEQAIAGLRGYADQFGVDIVFEAAQRDLLVRGDADRIEQVVTNLVSNAVKFSPAGETVSVTLKTDGDIAMLGVRDRGPGVPESFRSRIFTKFAQADGSDRRRKGGTGLGLAIAREIVERHAGALTYRNADGGGAEFEMRLPRYVAVQPSVALSSAKVPTVLVCEDDPLIAAILAEQMKAAGFEARVAGGVQDALTIIDEHTIDAMLVDLRLPDGDGVSLIRTLRAKTSTARIPIVVVSADATLRSADPLTTPLQVSAWLEKPVDPRVIAELLTAHLGGLPARPRILHVEDDPDLREVVSASLAGVADVVSVGSLAGARAQLSAGNFDLTIIDVMLEDGSGLDLLATLEAAAPRPIPAIIFSARDVDRDEARNAQVTMTKSRTSLAHLVSTVRRLIDRSDAAA